MHHLEVCTIYCYGGDGSLLDRGLPCNAFSSDSGGQLSPKKEPKVKRKSSLKKAKDGQTKPEAKSRGHTAAQWETPPPCASLCKRHSVWF